MSDVPIPAWEDSELGNQLRGKAHRVDIEDSGVYRDMNDVFTLREDAVGVIGTAVTDFQCQDLEVLNILEFHFLCVNSALHEISWQ